MAEALREQQFQLAAHLRDPAANAPPPGLEDRRLAIYRELFFNNIESLLSGNFPVIRKTLGDARWRVLAREFYARHRSHTPLFAEIGREFIRFLQERAQAGSDDPGWLAEMAHYEWVELGLQIADDEAPAHDAGGDLLAGVPILSPFAWALAYAWPVQHIGPDYQPSTPPEAPTLVLVRRDAHFEIRFAEISPLVFRLIELLRAGESSGRQALEQLAAEAGADDQPGFVEQGRAMLQRMRDEGTLLGTRL
ncbi:MAG TPA: putative DNA-binding domain-containing protein [Pseudoxanthomonas sp.]|nr:putative DNA-binding domain-containing protein [Pseudoxanthomonas sp.]